MTEISYILYFEVNGKKFKMNGNAERVDNSILFLFFFVLTTHNQNVKIKPSNI